MGTKVAALAILALPMLGSTAYAAPQADGSGEVMASVGSTAYAAPQADDSDDAMASDGMVYTSWGCNTNPSVNRFNTSYKPGNNSVTVYYNNHCNHSVSFHVSYFDTKNRVNHISDCVTIRAGVKSSKKFDKSLFDRVDGVWSGCS
ncbi:hypothetical protein [Kitasatospora purpeofusca]|uniref:hypothetical protein n=1 Tax=Kitasatospora purpeofusca TaxID=67352 RepID=UPI00364E31C1